MGVGACFGLFQALMPALGLAMGRGMRPSLMLLDHWAAFGLLLLVGGHMIWEEMHPGPRLPQGAGSPLAPGRLLLLAVATSLDAWAVGVSLAMGGGYHACHGLFIGGVTFALCTPGVLLGKRLKGVWGHRAGLLGGGILLLMAVRILAEHLVRGI